MQHPQTQPNELNIDRPFIERAIRTVGYPLRRYFRGEVLHLSRLPKGPALLVGNHNAGITMFEPFLLSMMLYESTKEAIGYLAHDLMLELPIVGGFLKRLGVIRAGHGPASSALDAGYKVMVFPGGNYEAFRPFSDRHRVDFNGRHGFARLALQKRVPIVPVLCLGGHETLFVLRRGSRIAKALGLKKLLRTDSFPIFFGLPWGIGIGPIFHLPLPAKTIVEIGEPIHVSGYKDDAHLDASACHDLASRVVTALQQMMDRRSEGRIPLFG
jgi:1-acyl-sn-glycerol-3-phosphate acyltransferase